MFKPITRRDFLRTTAFGIAATGFGAGSALAQSTSAPAASSGASLGNGGTPPGPNLPAEPTGRPSPTINGDTPRPTPPARQVRWAVCGLGHFAQNYMLAAIAEASDARLTGLISGSPAKLERVGRDWAVPTDSRYGYDMAGLANNDEIDVVYIATPNAIHEANAIAAAEAGKHVFCEKPMATSGQAAQRMIDACNANGVALGIAYRAHFEPHNVEAKRMIDAGELGRIDFVSSDHHRPLDPSATHDVWRMQEDVAGGGSLPDIGIYGLNGLIWFLGESPAHLVAQTSAPAFDDGRFAEVEAIANVLLEFPSGCRGQISSGYIASKKRIDVWGADAVAVLDPATSYQGNTLNVSTARGVQQVATDYPANHQFWGEVDHFSRHVRDGDALRIDAAMGLRDVRIIEAIYASAARGAWVELDGDGLMTG